jgi:hypothetical protein
MTSHGEAKQYPDNPTKSDPIGSVKMIHLAHEISTTNHVNLYMFVTSSGICREKVHTSEKKKITFWYMYPSAVNELQKWMNMSVSAQVKLASQIEGKAPSVILLRDDYEQNMT